MSQLSDWQRASTNDSKSYVDLVEKADSTVGAFLEFDPTRRIPVKTDGPLAGIPIAVKDNIAVRDFRLTCGSRIMGEHVSPYDATVVDRLVAAGMVPVGKTNLDEFGMGSSTDNSAVGQTNNPWDPGRVAGGSSGGSAAAVAAGMVPVALGSDTGGSVRQPAAFCGVYGLKPTYGLLSRYGLVAYASSLETIGIVSDEPANLREVLRAAIGVDIQDQTTVQFEAHATPASEAAAPASVGFLAGDLDLDPPTQTAYAAFRDAVTQLGIETRDVELKTTDVAVSAYYTIATAEASANLARFNGVRYGDRPLYSENPEELVRSARSQGFGQEVITRILLGTYVLRSGFQEQYYQRAQKIRTAIRNELDTVFGTFDMLALPVFPTVAFPHGEAGLSQFQQKLADRFTTLANLTAAPALSIPAGVVDGLPVGIQLMGPAHSEFRLITLAERLAELLPYTRPPQYAHPLCELFGSEGA